MSNLRWILKSGVCQASDSQFGRVTTRNRFKWLVKEFRVDGTAKKPVDSGGFSYHPFLPSDQVQSLIYYHKVIISI